MPLLLFSTICAIIMHKHYFVLERGFTMRRSSLRSFMFTAILCALLCVFALSGVFGLAERHPLLAALAELFIFLPVLYIGRGVFLRMLRKRRLCETVFSASAAGLCILFSLIEIFMIVFTSRGFEYLLFAPGAAVIALTLLCDYMYERIRPPRSKAIYILTELRPKTAAVLRDGSETVVPIEEISAGDIISVRPGEDVPCDGEIVAGRSDMDESVLNGELLPVFKSEGDTVKAGSKNLSGFLTVRVSNADSELDAGISACSCAKRPNYRTFYERFAVIYSVAVLAFALFSAMILIVSSSGTQFAAFAFVCLIALLCPSGMSVAHVAASMSAAKRAASDGVLLRDPSAIERLQNTGSVVIDKTGTATVGKLAVTEIIQLGDISKAAIIRIAAALSADLADADFAAIAEHCRLLDIAIPPCIALERLPGRLTGLVDGQRAELSSLLEDIEPFADDYPKILDLPQRVVLYGGEAIGLISFDDKLKPNAIAAVKEITERGIKCSMISSGESDYQDTDPLCISGLKRGLDATQKAEYIRDLRSDGAVVMIGDGVSDCAALRTADFSFALNSGAEAAKESASAVLLRNDLRDVLTVMEISALSSQAEKLGLLGAVAARGVAFAASSASIAFAGIRFGIVAMTAGILLSALVTAVMASRIKVNRE